MKNEIICHCNDISRDEIVKAILEKGLSTIEEIQKHTTAGEVCGGCIPDLEIILEETTNNNKTK